MEACLKLCLYSISLLFYMLPTVQQEVIRMDSQASKPLVHLQTSQSMFIAQPYSAPVKGQSTLSHVELLVSEVRNSCGLSGCASLLIDLDTHIGAGAQHRGKTWQRHLIPCRYSQPNSSFKTERESSKLEVAGIQCQTGH